jgi:hypothetical protein
VADEQLPEVKFAVHPQRKCRHAVTEDGLIDHWCDLPAPAEQAHPGPCCPSTLRPAITRRARWEKANPGWEKMQRDSDPFADFTKIPGVT